MLLTLCSLASAFSPIARAPPRAHARAGPTRMGLFDFMRGGSEPGSASAAKAAAEVPRGMCAASHILLRTAEEAQALKARLDAGELTFEDAAIQSSACPSGRKGGDLGCFRSIKDVLWLPYEGKGAPEFDAACVDPATELGEVVVVDTAFGTHLLRVYGRGERDD